MLKKQSNDIKLIALFIAIILIIIALVFGVSKFILKDQDENTPIQFNEYKVQEQEIVLSSEEYTGDSIIVTVTPSILPVVNSGKTGIDVMKLQYQITEPDAILSNNDNDWIDYIEPVEVDHNSTFNTRLVTRGHTDTSLEMDYTSPVTSREINNIAVAQLGNKTYKTLAEAITAWGDLTTEEKQTSTIQMLANTSENIIIPQTEEIKIDLCGFDIIEESSETPTIIVNGVLNIVDSGKTENNSTTYGKVTSTSNTAIKVTGANSELVLGTNESANGEDDEEVNKEGPVINGGTGSNGVLVEQGGNLEFYDGKITAPKTAQAGANTAIVVNNTPVGNENCNLITVPTGYRLDLSDDETAGREIATVVKKMMVSFDSNGGEPSNIADIEVGEGKAYGKYAEWPSNPTREGYTFKGWSTNLADVISENNYSIYNFDNRTTSEFRNDGEFLGLTNQPYIRIKGNESNSNIDTLWSISAKNEINVTAGKKYILSFYARSENSIRTQYIGMYSNSVSGKTSIGWSDGSITYLEEDINFDNDGEWHLITKEFIAPDNVSTGKIKIGNDIPNIYGTNSYIDIANIHFSEDESIVPYITQSTPVTQTQDHTLKAVWIPNTYNTRFVSGNLMDGKKLVAHHATLTENNNIYTVTTNTATGGCYIPDGIFEDGKKYKLSFNIQKKDGELVNIAGHAAATSKISYKIDGIEQNANYYSVYDNIPNDENIHTVEFEFIYDLSRTNDTDKKIYIQPNRQLDTRVIAELSNIQIYEIVEDSQKVYGTQLGTLQTPERTAYLFDGWYTQQIGGTEVTSSTNVPSQDTTYYAHWTPAVASTTINGTTSYYRTVQAAIGAIPADGTEQSEGTLGTVTLLYDGTREESVVVSEGQNVVLNTNGKTLKSTTNTITNSGILIITGNGTIESTSESAINNSGILEVSDGTIKAQKAAINNTGTSTNENNPSVKISGGNIYSTANYAIANQSTGNVVLNSGSITGNAGIRNGVDCTGTTIVNGGSINVSGHGIRNYVGNVQFNDGEIRTGKFGDGIWTSSTGSILVTGGRITGGTNGVVTTGMGTITITGGTIEATTTDSAGNAVQSKGELTIGNKDDNRIASNESPVLIGSNRGIVKTNGTEFNFYDGIVKAPEGKTITGTITDTPEGYRIINGTEETLETAYLDNHYTVTFDGNGTTPSKANMTVEYGKPYGELATVSRTGYTFGGWKTVENLISTNPSDWEQGGLQDVNGEKAGAQMNSTRLRLKNYLPVSANTVYKMNVNNSESIVIGHVWFYNANKEYISTNSVYAGTNLEFTTPANCAYIKTVLMYSNETTEITTAKVIDANLKLSAVTDATTIVSFPQNHTLKAIWTPNQYTISFNANDGTGTMADQPMTYGTSANLTANSFTRTGYEFAGWNTEADGSGTSYTDEESVSNLTVTNNASVTLYAQWEVETSGLNNASPNMQLQSITPKSLNRNNIQTIQPENTQQSVQSQITNTVQINQTQYQTIAEALESAQNGDTITLLEDVSLTDEVIIGKEKNIKINLNGKTLTSTSNNTINNQGILTIKGTGIIKNEIENGIVIYNTGSLNMEDGVVTTAENGGKAISNNGDGSNYQGSDTNNVEKSGTVNIKSGKIVTEGIGAIGLYNANNAKANISGGIFETRNYASKAIYNDSELEIENAKVVVSDYDSIGIYNGKNSKSCIIKENEIFIEAEEIENYELIKNTDQFKEYIDKLKPSYGIYNDSDSEVIIETAAIKAERLKSVGIMNNAKGTVTLGVDESKDGKEIELNNASPIVYAISDNTTAIINNKDGIINFYDGRVLTTSTIKNMIVNVLNNYEIYEELNSNVINTTLRLIVEEVESGSVDSNSEEISENESSEETENVDNESEDI